jgi:hypothetical protein
MKKQIIYADFIARLFAMTLDLFFLSLLIAPVSGLASKYIFIFCFREFLLEHKIDLSQAEAIANTVSIPEFAEYASGGAFVQYVAIYFIAHFLFSGIYFVGCWRYFGTNGIRLSLHPLLITKS